jgi:hypothetical protein
MNYSDIIDDIGNFVVLNSQGRFVFRKCSLIEDLVYCEASNRTNHLMYEMTNREWEDMHDRVCDELSNTLEEMLDDYNNVKSMQSRLYGGNQSNNVK